ncbi:MFS transporter [Marivirga atlantica]|uniref:MFS transporter n=1 Tax=Marivirga atlantica TaxID=1548457 RepID=A0A937DK67_9BACT|nr:MFS transporter [Marivirga atlantica]MBL0765921.1 MFS transporter [Marivirga atlantica]
MLYSIFIALTDILLGLLEKIKTAFTGSGKVNILPLLSVNFIGALGYSIILPFLVYLVKDFGGNEVIYGLMGAVYPAFQLVGGPILGKWSDRVGRKKVLLISQIGTFVSWLVFIIAFFVPQTDLFKFNYSGSLVLFTLPLLVLFIARAFDGLTGGNISVANAYLSDISDKSNRKKNFGKMSSAMNLGFIIGPVISGYIAALNNGELKTVILAAIISFVAIFIIQFLLKNPKNDDNSEQKTAQQNTSTQIDISVWKIKQVPLMVALFFLIYLAFNFFYATFPIYAANILEWDSAKLGPFFAVLSGVMILVQGPGLSYLNDYFSEKQLFFVGGILLIGMFYCLTFTNVYIIYTGAILFGLGNGLMWPSFLSILATKGTKQQQGAIQALNKSRPYCAIV